MTLNRPMKLGMLGMWHTHADGIARRIFEHPDEFQLVGCWDPEPEVVANRTATWGTYIPDFRVYDRPEQVLDLGLDGVIVESRVHHNVQLARMAIDANLPVMLEKPAGTDLQEFKSLLEVAQSGRLRVQMIYLFRYLAAVQELLRRVRAGELGRVYSFRARLPKDLSEYDRFVDELRPYRGGMFFEMAGHVIDLMAAVLGKALRTTGFLAHHHVEPPASYVDHGLAVFEFERAFGMIEVPAIEVAPDSRRIEVYGTEGALIIPHLGSGHLRNSSVPTVQVYRAGDTDWTILNIPPTRLQIADLREFSAVVAGQKNPDFSSEHDLAVQEMLLSACGMTEAVAS